MADLSTLTPEQIQGLLALLEQKEGEGQRTGVRKFLHDLRDPGTPKARLNRPSFFWSADADPGTRTTPTPYPKLKFRLEEDQVVETVIFTAAAEAALGPQWLDAPPLTAPVTHEDGIAAELAGLSDEDRQIVLAAQREARLKSLTARMDTLSDAALERVTGEPVRAKRGPGRPKKTA